MPMTSEDFDRFLNSLRAAAAAAEAEDEARQTHADHPGVSDIPSITLYAVSSISGGPNLTIVYTDTDGVTSIRHIRVNSIERCLNGYTIVRCYDLDRQAPRSFRLDRIIAAATEYRELDSVTWVR